MWIRSTPVMSNLRHAAVCRLCAMSGLWLLGIIHLPAASGQPTWDDRFGFRGANGNIFRILVHDNALYVGGAFSFIDGHLLSNIAKWDGTNWSSLGSGVDGAVVDMASGPGGLYVCGSFTHAGGTQVGRIARWDGTNWWPVGNGTGIRSGEVKAFAIQGSNIYVGGNFSAVDEVEVYHVAKWDGQRWSAAGTWREISPNGVWDLAVSKGVLYGAGDFYSEDQHEILRLGRWNGTRWETGVGGGLDNDPFRLESDGENLYALGIFHRAGNLDVNGFAGWNGAQWFVPTGLTNSRVDSVTWDGATAYFAHFDGTTNRFSRWDITNLTTLATSDLAASQIAVFGGSLYVGGWFSVVNGIRTGNLARFDGVNWSSLGEYRSSGMNGFVHRVAPGGSNVFALGEFNLAGDTPVLRAAKWNGSAWEAPGSGIDGPISDAIAKGDDLYVVGSFTSAGGVPATNVAHWNGSIWSLMGSGLLGATALTIKGDSIYAAGAISLPGSDKTWNIVRWDGSQWVPVADGIGDSPRWLGWGRFITSLAAIGDDLYVAGNFLTAAEVPVNHIAKWTSQGWQALGTGVQGSGEDAGDFFNLTYIDDIAVDGGNLYVGGSFTNVGGVAACNIAKWDGSKWSALGTGLGLQGFFYAGHLFFPVSTLAVKDGVLYAGGQFGSPTRFLARWDGKRWSEAAGGVNSYIISLAANGDDLYVGGTMTFAGNRPSYYFGILHGGFLPSLWSESSGSGLSICWPADATNYIVQSSLAGLGTSWHDVQDQTETTKGVKRLRVAASSPQTFFRLRKVVGN